MTKEYHGIPDCSEPDELEYPPNINSMLRDIKCYRMQLLDPVGYIRRLRACADSAKNKVIKGSAEGGKKL